MPLPLGVPIPLKKLHLKYRGLFDMDDIYRFFFEWLKNRMYNVHEKRYKNKPDSPWGYEHEIDIVGDKKVDETYKYTVVMKVHARDCAEIIHNGKKLTNGRIDIFIDANIIIDYQNRFGSKDDPSKFATKVKRFIGVLWSSLVYWDFAMLHWDFLHYSLHEFQQEIKTHLNMYADENYYR